MKQQIPACILVDFDGTLIDSIGSLFDAYCRFLRLYGQKGSKDEFNSLNGPSVLEVVGILKVKYNISDEIDELYRKYNQLIAESYANSSPFADADKFLSFIHAKGIKLILVTSSRSQACLPLIDKFGWDKYFSDFVWGEDVKKSKPSPDIYIKALNKAGVDRDRVVVIEDSVNGTRAGDLAGIRVLALAIDFSEDDLIAAGAKEVYENLSAVLESVFGSS